MALNLGEDVLNHLQGFEITDTPAPIDNASLRKRIEATFHPGRLDIPESRFRAWVNEADYRAAGPSWWNQFEAHADRKLLEHYSSIELIGLHAGGIYMDAAASASPFYQVVRRTHGAAMGYRQDLNRAPGVHGDTIGSDASAIPLPDAFLDGIVTHNSWEHFEGESAFGFIREAARLLRPGAKLCIVPINFSTRIEIWTSPSCWPTKYRNAKELPQFDRRAVIVIKEEIIQRQVMWWTPEALKTELDRIASLRIELILVVCGSMVAYALVGTRI